MGSTRICDTANGDFNRQEMLQLLVDKKLYLFAGAGLSCRAGLPDWETLLKGFSESYKARPEHSPARAAEASRFAERGDIEFFEIILNDTTGQEVVIEGLKKHFGTEISHSLHEVLLRLPFCGFITTNYDRCFEAACTHLRDRIDLNGKRWFCFPPDSNGSISADELFRGIPFLLHLHGCIRQSASIEVQNIILTPSQYRDFYAEPAIKAILSSLSQKHVLLIGTSFRDRYFLDALAPFRKPRCMNERANMPKWFVLHKWDDEQSLSPIRDRENYCLHHVYYRDTDNQDGFSDIIQDMVEAVERIQRPLRKMKDSEVEGLGGEQ